MSDIDICWPLEMYFVCLYLFAVITKLFKFYIQYTYSLLVWTLYLTHRILTVVHSKTFWTVFYSLWAVMTSRVGANIFSQKCDTIWNMTESKMSPFCAREFFYCFAKIRKWTFRPISSAHRLIFSASLTLYFVCSGPRTCPCKYVNTKLSS